MNNSGQTYIIVTCEDNHFAIPKIWFLVQNNLSFGDACEWYWPTENALHTVAPRQVSKGCNCMCFHEGWVGRYSPYGYRYLDKV